MSMPWGWGRKGDSMAKSSILERIGSGERARLIPVTTARQKELATVSV